MSSRSCASCTAPIFVVIGACSSATTGGVQDGRLSDSPPALPCSGFVADSGFSCIGGFGEGETVTIAGPGAFGNKPHGAAALYIWDFSRGASTIPESRVSKAAPGYGSLVTDPVAPGSSGAWMHPVDRNFHEDTYRSGLEVTPPDLFVFTRMYFSFDGHEAFEARENDYGQACVVNADACWNQKGWRFWHEFTHDWLLGYGDDDPAGNPRWGFGLQDGGTTYDGSMYPRSWHTQNVMVHQSGGVDVADAWSQVAFNGRAQRIGNRKSRTSAYPEPLTRLYWFQVERTGWTAADGKFYAYDIVYVDDSLCRIVLTDQAVWDETVEHRVEIQIPAAWSVDSLTFRVRRPFPGAYVWAVRSDASPLRLGRI